MEFLYEYSRKITLNKNDIENSLRKIYANDLGINMNFILRKISKSEYEIIIQPVSYNDYKLLAQNIDYYNDCIKNTHKYANVIYCHDFTADDIRISIASNDEINSNDNLELVKVDQMHPNFICFAIYFKITCESVLV